jgi:type VI secretion system protein ImpG
VRPTESEFRVIPDARRALANEVYSVNKVIAHLEGKDAEVFPFYSTNHPSGENSDNLFWFPNRRKVEVAPFGREHKQNLGTDVYLSLIGLNGRSLKSTPRTLDVYTTCLNRNYPNELPRGSKLFLSGSDAMVQSQMLVHPTETQRPELTDQAQSPQPDGRRVWGDQPSRDAEAL